MTGNIAIFLMVIVGILLFVEIINFTKKYRRMKEKKEAVSLVIMILSFIFWLISIVLMIEKIKI